VNQGTNVNTLPPQQHLGMNCDNTSLLAGEKLPPLPLPAIWEKEAPGVQR